MGYKLCLNNDVNGVPKMPCDTMCRRVGNGFRDLQSTCSPTAKQILNDYINEFKVLCRSLVDSTLKANKKASTDTTKTYAEHMMCDVLMELYRGNTTVCDRNFGLFVPTSEGAQNCYEMSDVKQFDANNRTAKLSPSPSSTSSPTPSQNDSCTCQKRVDAWLERSIATTIILPICAFLILWIHLFVYTRTKSFHNCCSSSSGYILAGSNCAQLSVLLLLPLAQLGISILLSVIALYLTNKDRDTGNTFSIIVFNFVSLAIGLDAVLSITRSLAPPEEKKETSKAVSRLKTNSTASENLTLRVAKLREQFKKTMCQQTLTCCGSCLVNIVKACEWLIERYQNDFTYETGVYYLEIQLAAECVEVANQIYQLYVFSQVRDVVYLQVVCVLLLLNAVSMMQPVVFRRCLHAERTAKNLLVLSDTFLDVSYLTLALAFLSTCQFKNSPFLSTTSIIFPAVFAVDKLRDVVEYTRNQVSEHMIRVALRRTETLAAIIAAPDTKTAPSKKSHLRTISARITQTFSRKRADSVIEFSKRVPQNIQQLHMVFSILASFTTMAFVIAFSVAATEGDHLCTKALGPSLWHGSYPKIVVGKGGVGTCSLEKIRQIKCDDSTVQVMKLPESIVSLINLEIFICRNQSIAANGIPWRFLDGVTLPRLKEFDVFGNPCNIKLDLAGHTIHGGSILPYVYKFMNEIETLELSNTSMTCLPPIEELLSYLPSLSYLNISNNKELHWISPKYILNSPLQMSVASTVAGLHWAHQVPLGTNEQYLWERIAFHFPFITTLDLSNNAISCIPTSIFVQFQRLEELNFGYNQYEFGMEDCTAYDYKTGTRILEISNGTKSFWTPFLHPLSSKQLTSLHFEDNVISSIAAMMVCSAPSSKYCDDLTKEFSCNDLIHLSRIKYLNVERNFLSYEKNPLYYGHYDLPEQLNKDHKLYRNVPVCLNYSTGRTVNMGLELTRKNRLSIYNFVKVIVKALAISAVALNLEKTGKLMELDYPIRDETYEPCLLNNSYCNAVPYKTCLQKTYSDVEISLLSLQQPEILMNHGLIVLLMKTCHLTGWLPENIEEVWPHLNSLALIYTDITGAIPPSMGQLKQLKRLEISGGACIEGNIPKELGSSPVLQELVLRDLPGLVGSIPEELSALTHLYRFDFSFNPGVYPCNCSVGDTVCELERKDGKHIPRDRTGKKIVEWVDTSLYPNLPWDKTVENGVWGDCRYCKTFCIKQNVAYDCGRGIKYQTHTAC